ncbi:hypothetical protein KI688_007615 [Linnemannia hyalina]|uniref:FAD-binding domain-containing protein n=1 Tax=Linnemannia hyalina TaxID=64524 RepID=A0A9P7XI25_9FUNG|nr:hypothetical protein KI688_007615 [Linnemannia hyalina]
MSAPSETVPPTPSSSSAVPPVTPNKPPHVLIGGAGLAGLFLGILLERAGIPYEIFERSAEPRQLGVANCPDLIGYDRVIFSRPELHDMLFKKIPKEKLHMSNKMVTLDQDQDGVTMTFDDNTTAHGDILVGTDEAHSTVRQHLHKTLKKDGLLPNTIIQFGLSSTADEYAASSGWTNQENKGMVDEFRDFKTPYAPPSGGAGAVNAMQDPVLLANHLYDINPTNLKNTKTVLSDYKNERFDAIKDQYPQSHMSAKLIYGHTLWERVLRYVVFNWLPESLQRKQLVKDTAYRPQATF